MIALAIVSCVSFGKKIILNFTLLPKFVMLRFLFFLHEFETVGFTVMFWGEGTSNYHYASTCIMHMHVMFSCKLTYHENLRIKGHINIFYFINSHMYVCHYLKTCV